MNLPPELAERFTIVEELGSGGEGFVLRVEDDTGAPFVVKLYFANLTFDERATALLAAAEPAHVLSLEPGVASDGSRFEVMEWCEAGTLRDLLDGGHRLDVDEVVAEMVTALEHIHGLRLEDDPDARMVHQDLKPDNVMVRTVEPLDLVLGDFGLARMIAGSRHFTNRQQGSRAWAPPSGEAVTAGWDWWSLGMIIAEVAAGRHPFCVDGVWMSDAAISDHLSQSSVDLSDIEDDRTRTLCRGLLTRRTTDRWGASEVKRWLAGERVRVVVDAGGGERRSRTVLFNGTEYAEPADLALALQQDWDQAQEHLIQRTDGGALSQQVGLFLAAAGLPEAERLLRDTDHPPTRLANLLAEMNPDLPPIYRGRDIRPGALAEGLTSERSAARYVSLVEDAKTGLAQGGVLTCWRRLEGMSDAPVIERRIKDARSYIQSKKETINRLPGPTVDKLKAAIYAAAAQPDSIETLRRSVDALDTEAAQQQSWWKQILANASEYALVLAVQSEPVAREQTERENARREADRKVAEDKRRSEEEARRRDEEQRERADRRATTVQRWDRWAIPLLVAGVLATWLGAGLLLLVGGEKQDIVVSLLEWPFGWDWVSKVHEWWYLGPGENTASLDWIFGLDADDPIVSRAGGGLMATGVVGLVLSAMAMKSAGIDDDGRLRPVVRLLGYAVIGLTAAGVYAFLPWAFVAVSALFALVVILAVAIAILWLVFAMFGS